MQTERRVYEAASRAVRHQREADGSKVVKLEHAVQATASTTAGMACFTGAQGSAVMAMFPAADMADACLQLSCARALCDCVVFIPVKSHPTLSLTHRLPREACEFCIVMLRPFSCLVWAVH